MVTIQDVAKEAGVSAATVSRVLNNNHSVSIKTREKVKKVIKDLNYQPNLLGRNLRRMETRMVLVFLYNISNPFYSKIVEGMETIAHKNGYNVLMCNTNAKIETEQIYLNFIKNKLVDGIIFTSPAMRHKALSELAKDYPIVLCNEYERNTQAPVVTIDNEEAGYDAVNHLIRLGHKKIALIGSCQVRSGYERELGYRKALKEVGIEINESYIIRDVGSYKGGIIGVKKLLALKEKPTALFCISDLIAIGAIKQLKKNKLRVPEDIAVIGFDNNRIANMYDPSLTTIAQPRYDIGKKAMELMIKRIKGNLTSNPIIKLQHELIIRDSTLPIMQ